VTGHPFGTTPGRDPTSKHFKMKNLFIIILTFFIAFSASGQNLQYYYDYDFVYEIAVRNSAKNSLESLKRQIGDSLNKLNTQLDNLKESFTLDKSADSLTKASLEDSVKRLENNIYIFVTCSNNEFIRQQQSILTNRKQKLELTIKDFCEKYEIKNLTKGPPIPHCDNCLDLTLKLIAYMYEKE
jgi:Skp family chaperone for outer membrane proteins